MKLTKLPTQNELIEYFEYEPKTGLLKNKIARKGRGGGGVGSVAGKRTKSGYIRLGFKRKYYAAHRLIFVIVFGDTAIQDGYFIDHKNGKPFDNRLANLRLASPGQNVVNFISERPNKSGVRGVYFSTAKWHKNKWVAEAHFNGHRVMCKRFPTKSAAKAARHAKMQELYGDFYRGQPCKLRLRNRARGVPGTTGGIANPSDDSHPTP